MKRFVTRADGGLAFGAAAKWLFIVSATAAAGMFSIKGSLPFIAAGVPLAFAVLCVAVFRFRFLEKTFAAYCRWQAILSLALAAYAAVCYAGYFCDRLYRAGEELGSDAVTRAIGAYGKAFALVVGVVSALALFVYLYWFVSRFSAVAKRFLRGGDAVERWYLPIAFIAAAVLIVLLYSRTSVFSGPNIDADNVWDKIDIVYTSDTSSLVEQNVFLNVGASENDLRQPFFGVFAAPFALAASLISKLLFFLPGAYCVLIQLLQAGLLLFTALMIGRMLTIQGAEKALFLSAFTFLYPTLLFLLNMEQYIFSVFWLVLLVWQFVSADPGDRSDAWVAAAGSTLTSGILLVLVPKSRRLGAWLKECLLAAVKFAAVAALFGRAAMMASSAASMQFLMQFTGEQVPLLGRMQQYAAFVSACFVPPAAEVVRYESGVTAYQLSAVTGWSVPGLVLAAAALAGFLLNRRDSYARVCAGWAAFSFVLLCLIGWGTSENGLVLYTLYFSWAFVSLIALLIRRVFGRRRTVRCALFAAAAAALLILNIPGIGELVRFGMQYYPAG